MSWHVPALNLPPSFSNATMHNSVQHEYNNPYKAVFLLTHMWTDRQVELWDFDEDLSSLSEKSTCTDSDDDYDDDDENEIDTEEDAKSERTYTDDFADYYYELKWRREERKWELKEMRGRPTGARESADP
ncbi:hypothetical protein VTN49DRAFT_6073 [Thermomyces lanuginosus]|uniref:uncharacterized protein n=1 Tax=Thermomyces lanuginosus TaxID=5541 RepID=UPI003743D0DD